MGVYMMCIDSRKKNKFVDMYLHAHIIITYIYIYVHMIIYEITVYIYICI